MLEKAPALNVVEPIVFPATPTSFMSNSFNITNSNESKSLLLDKIEQEFNLNKSNEEKKINLPKSNLIEAEVNAKIFNLNKEEVKTIQTKHNLKETFSKIEKIFNKVYLMNSFKLLRKLKEKQILNEKKIKFARENHLRRVLIFFFKECIDLKWNRIYINELIKHKMNVKSNPVRFEVMEKLAIFNYDDFKKVLIGKINENEITEENNTYFMKLNIFTERKLFLSTKLFYNLFSNITSNLSLKEEKGLLTISDCFKINQTNFNIFISVYFIDEIDDLSTFITMNIESLNKFSYGLILMDYQNLPLLQNLALLIDYSIHYTTNKQLLILNYNKMNSNIFDYQEIRSSINTLEEKYKCKTTNYYFLPICKSNIYSNDYFEYYNNSEFFSIFENALNLQKKINFQTVSIYEYYNKLNFSRKIMSILETKKSFVSQYYEISDPKWITFFVCFEIIAVFTKSLSVIMKQMIHQVQEHLNIMFKQPYEIFSQGEKEFAKKMEVSKDVLLYISKELVNIDVFLILKEIMKKPSFNLEKFMMYPSIQNILTIYLNKLFSLFSNVNSVFNLEILGFRNKLMNYHQRFKSEFNISGSFSFSQFMKFLEEFLLILNIGIPVENNFSFALEENLLRNIMDEIVNKTHMKLKELLGSFKTTGLQYYIRKDKELKLGGDYEINLERNEYFIINQRAIEIVDNYISNDNRLYLDYAQETNKEVYHVRSDIMNKFFEDKKDLERKFLLHKRGLEVYRNESFEISNVKKTIRSSVFKKKEKLILQPIVLKYY